MEQSAEFDMIGKRMLESAISMDESLVEILKIEVKRLKQAAKSPQDMEELRRINNLVKHVIIALTITDERIRTGIELCANSGETEKCKSHVRD